MKTQTLTYFDGSQKLIGKLFHPKEITQVHSAIIVFHAFDGRSEFTLHYAKKLAEHGYIVLAADMYGEAKTAETIPTCFDLITPFLKDRFLVRRRANLALEALSQHPLVDKNKIGAIGFCFGGMCALEVARSGANLTVCIGLHSALVKSDLPTHPIHSKIFIMNGYEDPQVPPESIQNFAKEMKEAQVKDWNFLFFGQAQHSFTDPRTGTFDQVKEKEMGRVYDPRAAERSFRYVIDFFAESLN